MKSGIVAVVGRANAGKSTLVNVLVGEKVSIVSPKPQTTRDRILGVLTEADYQIVFADTPGLYKAESHLNALMQRTAEQSARDVDLILFVMDAHAGMHSIDGLVPLSEMFGYATDLRSKTQGRGTYTMQFAHYEEVPKSIASKVLGTA